MKKIFLAFIVFLFTASSFAQETTPVKAEKDNSEIKQLQADRDTAKVQVRRKTSENTRDNNKFIKLQNEKKKLKDQLKTAKKSKKSEKIEAIEVKVDDNLEAIKELEPKLKEEEKELDQLEKDLKNAEKALKTAKAKEAKEKAKGKK